MNESVCNCQNCANAGVKLLPVLQPAKITLVQTGILVYLVARDSGPLHDVLLACVEKVLEEVGSEPGLSRACNYLELFTDGLTCQELN